MHILAILTSRAAAAGELQRSLLHATDPHAALSRPQEREEPDALAVEGGVAVIGLRGVLMRGAPSWAVSRGIAGDPDLLGAKIREARGRQDVSAVLLRVDSPGGSIWGIEQLAAEVSAAAAVKPVLAYVEGMAASAAYWAISGATHIMAGQTALVGSIGVYAVLEDLTGMADQMGIKVHVMRSGARKALGQAGEAIGQDAMSDLQEIVDATATQFLAAVREGRGLDDDGVGAIADGAVHPTAAAMALGLVDSIGLEADAGQFLAVATRPARGATRRLLSARIAVLRAGQKN